MGGIQRIVRIIIIRSVCGAQSSQLCFKDRSRSCRRYVSYAAMYASNYYYQPLTHLIISYTTINYQQERYRQLHISGIPSI